MRLLNLFSHEEFVKNTYVVTENYSGNKRFTIGVIVGAERVLVIDTGFGMAGDLRKYIESFVGTQKPIFCICTHGHSDCIGGASQFDEAYLHSADAGKYLEAIDKEKRFTQLKEFSGNDSEIISFGKEMYLDNSQVNFLDLKDGDHFHLGGVHVAIIEVPGHTPGSIAVRVTREGVTKTTFCGDVISSEGNCFTNMNAQELLTYSQRLEDLMNSLEDGEPIYCTHSAVPMNKKAGKAIAKACDEVAHGMTENDPAYVSEDKNQKNLKMHYAGNYYIVYNSELV